MKRLLILALLVGCTPTKPVRPLDCRLDALCETPCAPLEGWDGTRDGDRLTGLMDAHDIEHAECDQHRAACLACIETARKAKVLQ